VLLLFYNYSTNTDIFLVFHYFEGGRGGEGWFVSFPGDRCIYEGTILPGLPVEQREFLICFNKCKWIFLVLLITQFKS